MYLQKVGKNGLNQTILFQISGFYLKYKLFCQKPAHSYLNTFLKCLYLVHGMYNFGLLMNPSKQSCENRISPSFRHHQKDFWDIKKGRLLCNNQGIYPTSPYISFWGPHLPTPLRRRRLWMVPYLNF